MNGAYYCRSELTAPWGLTLPAMKGYMWFHVVTSGTGWLLTEGSDPRPLDPGAFALVPGGQGHTVCSEPGARPRPIEDLPLERVSDRYEVLRHGDGGAPTTMICGAVRFDHPAAQEIVDLMPNVLYLPPSGPLESEWMHTTLRLVASEARALRPGDETVIIRLCDVVVIQAIRTWISGTARAGGAGSAPCATPR